MRSPRGIGISFMKCMYQWRVNPRMPFILIVLWLMTSLIGGLFIVYVHDEGMLMGALEPFIALTSSHDSWWALILMCGMILINMDAPFFSGNDALFIPRLGRWNWARGRIVYLIAVSFLLPFVLAILMTLTLAPFTFFHNKWSPAVVEIILDTETHIIGATALSIPPVIPWSIISSMNPLGAALWTCALMGLMTASVNMLMMVISMSYNSIAGAGIGLALTVSGATLHIQLARWSPFINGRLASHYFAVGDNAQNYPTLLQSIIYFIVILWLGTSAMLLRSSRHSFKWGE